MVVKLLSRFQIALARYLFYSLFRRKDSTLRKKGNYKTIHDIMKGFQDSLIKNQQLNEDFTEGSVPARTKNGQKLIAAFVNHRHHRKEEDVYIQIAKEWVEGYEHKFHRISLLFVVLFIVWWICGIVFTSYMSGWIGWIFLNGLFLYPQIGFLSALFGKGWKRWALMAVNLLFLLVFFGIIL